MALCLESHRGVLPSPPSDTEALCHPPPPLPLNQRLLSSPSSTTFSCTPLHQSDIIPDPPLVASPPLHHHNVAFPRTFSSVPLLSLRSNPLDTLVWRSVMTGQSSQSPSEFLSPHHCRRTQTFWLIQVLKRTGQQMRKKEEGFSKE